MLHSRPERSGTSHGVPEGTWVLDRNRREIRKLVLFPGMSDNTNIYVGLLSPFNESCHSEEACREVAALWNTLRYLTKFVGSISSHCMNVLFFGSYFKVR